MEVHFAVWQGRVSGNRALIDGTEMLRFFNDRFIHEITHEKRSVRPEECCGGILADEMGMGKSLTLLALILSSLDEARISKPCSMRKNEKRTILQSNPDHCT